MLPTRPIYAFALLFLLTGCADTPPSPDSTSTADESHDAPDADSNEHGAHEHDADEPAEPTEPAESEKATAEPAAGSGAAKETPAEPATSKHEYLELPDGMPPQLVMAYEQIANGAHAGEVMGLLDLAGISQDIAKQIKDTDSEKSDGFYKQAAVALRAGRKIYSGELPGSAVGLIFFNEARAFARGNNIEAATKSLEEAMTSGFSDMDALRAAEDLAVVRDADGFAEKLVEWEAAAIAKVTQHAKEELAAGKSFPFEFALEDLDGKEHVLADYKGKVVIVDIWGTWCGPCRQEIPSFVKLQSELGDKGFQMLGLNYEQGENPEADAKVVKASIEEFGINYPCILGDEETQNQVPDFRGFPTTLFIDRTGKVRMMAVGAHEYEFLKGVVTELLAEEAPTAG